MHVSSRVRVSKPECVSTGEHETELHTRASTSWYMWTCVARARAQMRRVHARAGRSTCACSGTHAEHGHARAQIATVRGERPCISGRRAPSGGRRPRCGLRCTFVPASAMESPGLGRSLSDQVRPGVNVGVK